jgi:septal ring factor EnvC (AmiA/AmiB activator)
LRVIGNPAAAVSGAASLSALLGSVRVRKDLLAVAAAALLAALLALVLASAPRAGAADAESLETKLTAAREEATAVSADLRASNERLLAAEGEEAAAAAREQRLSALLAEGEARTAELSAEVERTRARLAAEKARLRRAHHALAERLVAIYESGSPTTASLILASSDYQELITRTDYLRAIAESDRALADRVEQVRDAVHREVGRVAELREQALAHDERLAAARSEIASVRERAQAAAAELQSLGAAREASLATLKDDIASWVEEVQEARAAEARAASAAAAEEEVGRWLGGPYSIPTYVVMCESGGDYGAVNPSSGAGGAYQILPSTWELYGGQGEPQNGSKAEQDRIAAEIWADSGSSAWVCG